MPLRRTLVGVSLETCRHGTEHICIHMWVSMGKVAQIGSERSQVAEPGPGVQVPEWPIVLEEVGLLSLRVSRKRKRNCQVGVLRRGIRPWRTYKCPSNLST